MKLTQKELLELAAVIGLEGVELVEDEAQSQFELNAALKSIDGNRRKVLEPQIKSELETDVKRDSEGRIHGTWRAALGRVTGLSNSKLKDIENIEDAIKLAVSHKVEAVAGSTEDTTKKFEEMLLTHQQEIEAKDKEWSNKYGELNEKYVSRDMLDFFQTKLKDAPLPEKLDKSIAAKDLMNHLKDKFHLSYDEAKKVVALMDKENPTIPALNAEKNAQIDVLQEAKSFFEPRALWVTDMRDKNPAEAMGNRGERPNIPGMAQNTGPKTPDQLRQERLATYDKAAV